MSAILDSVNGITNLFGAGQQRKAAAQENRNQVLQMVMASKMQQNQQNQQQTQANPNNPEPKSNTTFFVIGGIGLLVIVLIGIIVWKQQKA